MLQEYSPVTQALLGTLFTWAMTAAGSAVVIIIQGKQVNYVSYSLYGVPDTYTLNLSEIKTHGCKFPDRIEDKIASKGSFSS